MPLFTRPVLDDLHDARYVLLGAALEDAVLQHQPYRLAHPHRDAEFFTLRDGQIDVRHEYLDGWRKSNVTGNTAAGKMCIGGRFRPVPLVRIRRIAAAGVPACARVS